MEFRQNGSLYSVKPEYVGKDIMVAIDASKTNSCMFVADKYGNVLDDYELSGKAEDNILDQCFKERQFLTSLLMGANVIVGGIEDIITKKDKGEISRGMMEHESRFKITAIFMSFISYFQDHHNFTLELINNWAWKSNTLPEEFRSGEYAKDKKGSLAYHKRLKTKYANRKDDVTDAYQILQYLKIIHNITDTVVVEGPKELTRHKHAIWLFSSNSDVAGTRQFICNSTEYSPKDIVSFIANRLIVKQVGYCLLPISMFTIDEIYSLCSGNFMVKEDNLILAVRRDG